MLSIDQLDEFKGSNPSLQMLKPWWDVFTDYLSIGMVLVSVLAGAMQASKGNLYCLPTFDCNSAMLNQSMSAFGIAIDCKVSSLKANHSSLPTTTVLLKLQSQGQYDFVNSECSYTAVHWFASYFSFIIFLESVLLTVANHLCLKLPLSLSIMEHFVSMVTEGNSISGKNLHVCNTLWDTDPANYYNIDMSEQQNRNRSAAASLDTVEPNKARSLQEKVQKFQDTQKKREEKAGFVRKFRWIYFIQSFLKCVLSVVLVVINSIYFSNLEMTVKCKVDYFMAEKTANFKCLNVLIPFFIGVFRILLLLVIAHGILAVGTLIWTCRKIYYNKYDFSMNQEDNEAVQLGEIDPVTGDTSFLFHLLDKYNKLYSNRFAIFFSKTNKEKLKTYILAKDWPVERLERFSTDCGHTLKLPGKLCGIPKTVFEMTNLHVIELRAFKKLPDSNFDHEGWKELCNLRTLKIISCHLYKIPVGIFKIKTLERLDLSDNQIECIPEDIQKLKELKMLNMCKNNVSEGVQHLIAMKDLTIALTGNPDLKLDRFCSDRKQMKCNKVYIDEQNITPQAKCSLGDSICFDNACLYIDPIDVVKYSPDQYPEVEQERRTAENVYHMTSYLKGLALVIKLEYTSTPPVDRKNEAPLENHLQQIGYKCYDKYMERDKWLRSINTENVFIQLLSRLLNDNKQLDSLVIVWLGCCTQEGLILEDGQTIITVKRITEILNGFANLAGKPKLLYIQACLHESHDHIVHIKATSQHSLTGRQLLFPDSTTKKEIMPTEMNVILDQESLPYYKLKVDRPACDDVVIAVSTLQSHYSLVSHRPFWCVKALVEIFSEFACKEDVVSMLGFVNCELSRKCISKKNYKHIYRIESTLTKKWYLFPGYYEPREDVLHETNV